MNQNNPYDAPSQATPVNPQVIGKMVTIKRIGILSSGLMTGAMYVFIALVLATVMLVMTILGIEIKGDADALVLGVGFSIFLLVFLPIIYGILGFIFGVIMAAVYNVAARMTGGIQLNLDG
jgi:hypothetical protein